MAELAQDPSQLERLSRAAKQLGDKFTVAKMFANYAELFWATIKSGRRQRFLKGSSRIVTVLRKLEGLMQEPYEFTGYPTLTVPLAQSGIIELSADQWFVPAELGLSPDGRRLCYRVASASTVKTAKQ